MSDHDCTMTSFAADEFMSAVAVTVAVKNGDILLRVLQVVQCRNHDSMFFFLPIASEFDLFV